MIRNTSQGGAAMRRAAVQEAHRVMVAIENIRAAEGADLSLRTLARALTEQGIPTPCGGAGTATTVQRVLVRASEGG